MVLGTVLASECVCVMECNPHTVMISLKQCCDRVAYHM